MTGLLDHVAVRTAAAPEANMVSPTGPQCRNRVICPLQDAKELHDHQPAREPALPPPPPAGRPGRGRRLALHDDMRRLWEDHITWTRLAIVTFAADAKGFPATAERLLQNQEDIGDAIKPFYGEAA